MDLEPRNEQVGQVYPVEYFLVNEPKKKGVCECKTGCIQGNCNCLSSNRKCTERCRCVQEKCLNFYKKK